MTRLVLVCIEDPEASRAAYARLRQLRRNQAFVDDERRRAIEARLRHKAGIFAALHRECHFDPHDTL